MEKDVIRDILEKSIIQVRRKGNTHTGICFAIYSELTNLKCDVISSYIYDTVVTYIPEFKRETFRINKVYYCGVEFDISELTSTELLASYWWPLTEEGQKNRIAALQYLLDNYYS